MTWAWTKPRSTVTSGPWPRWGWPGTWPTSSRVTGGLLTSAQLAHLCQQVNATRYTDCPDVRAGLLRTYQVPYSRSGLTGLLHRLGFPDQLITPVPCQANAGAQADFLDELAVPEAHVERGEAALDYADACSGSRAGAGH